MMLLRTLRSLNSLHWRKYRDVGLITGVAAVHQDVAVSLSENRRYEEAICKRTDQILTCVGRLHHL